MATRSRDDEQPAIAMQLQSIISSFSGEEC